MYIFTVVLTLLATLLRNLAAPKEDNKEAKADISTTFPGVLHAKLQCSMLYPQLASRGRSCNPDYLQTSAP